MGTLHPPSRHKRTICPECCVNGRKKYRKQEAPGMSDHTLSDHEGGEFEEVKCIIRCQGTKCYRTQYTLTLQPQH